MAERRRMFWARILEDPDYQSLPMAARLLFNAMVLEADDEGRGQSDNRVWKLRAFPYDSQHLDLDAGEIIPINSAEITRLREMLTAQRGSKAGMIIEYDGPCGERLYQITKWARYQSVDHPQPSSWPPPAGFQHAKAQTVGPGRRSNSATEDQIETIDTMCRERGLVDEDFIESQGHRKTELLARDASLLIRKLKEIRLREQTVQQWEMDAAEIIRAWRSGNTELAESIIDKYPEPGRETNGIYYTVSKRITGSDQMEIPDMERLRQLVCDHPAKGEDHAR